METRLTHELDCVESVASYGCESGRFDASDKLGDSVTRMFIELDPLFEGSRKKELTRVASNTCTQTVTGRRHAADVSVTSGIGSGPCGAGPVGVVVKISHRLGIQTDAVETPHGSPKRVSDLDGVVHPPP
jgi:hypothetical protein